MFSFNQIHRDLSGESAQLNLEYKNINLCIQTDEVYTYVPECWSGFVTLKAEYYKGLHILSSTFYKR